MTSGPEGGSTLLGRGSHFWLRVAGVFVLGGVFLIIYLWLVGVGAIQRAIDQVPPRRSVSLAIVGAVSIVFWGSGLHFVLIRFGIAKRLSTSVLLFSAAGFLNSVTPFGQAGGDPLSAVLLKRSLGTDFETGLAAIGSVNALNRVGSLVLGVIGVGYLGTQVTFGATLRTAVVTIVIAALAVLGGGLALWHYRDTCIRWSASGLAWLSRPLDRLPGITPPSRDSLLERGHRFTAALEWLADAPKTLVLVLSLGLAGHFAVAATLWVALAALGAKPPIAIVLLIIPVAKVSGAAPTPGGFGSAEVVLTALLVATLEVEPAVAGAAALLYRASAFWLPSMAGVLATVWYGLQNHADSRRQSGTHPSRYSVGGTESPVLRSADTVGRLPLLGVAVSLAVVVLLIGSVHSRHLLIEPESVLVHMTRDASLVVLSFGLTWLTLRAVALRWVR